MYAPEVNSLRARHKGGAVQSMALWGGCFLVVMVTPPGVANLSWSVTNQFKTLSTDVDVSQEVLHDLDGPVPCMGSANMGVGS